MARIRASGRANGSPESRSRVRNAVGQQRAEIAEALGFAAVDIFGHAAGKTHIGNVAVDSQRIEPQQVGAAGARRAAARRLEQTIGHGAGEGVRSVFGQDGAGFELQRKLGAEPAAGFLEPHDAAVGVEHDQPGADIERGDADHFARGAHRDLRGAAADIDIHHRRAVADRARHGAGAVGRHHRFQTVAGADRDHPACLACEQFADAPRILPPHRDTGEDQRAGIDLVRLDLGVLVLARDEGAERIGVDGVFAGIGRQQDVGLIEALALGDDIAAVEPLQHDAREYQVRGRRADIDADREHAELVIFAEGAPGVGEEDAAADFIAHAISLFVLPGPSAARNPESIITKAGSMDSGFAAARRSGMTAEIHSFGNNPR